MQSLVNSQTIAFPSPGMGFNVHYAPNSRLYLDFGLSDANGDPQRSPHDSLNSFLNGQYFQALEAGYSVPRSAFSSALEEGNYRLMLWNAAKTSSHPSGNGIALSIDQEIAWSLVPFTRIGYCPQGIYRTSTEVDWGVMWIAPFGRSADRMGLGATWARPTVTPSRDQFAMELLYRVEFVEGIQLSPDVQFVFNPALNPNSSFQPVFGLRIRAYI